DYSGLELLAKIRHVPPLEDLPVVIISGNSQPLDIQNGYLAGASAYLTKPVSFWDLKQTIDKLVK
ncbi:MAG: response regulator, partial [Anaerolineales bacterium]